MPAGVYLIGNAAYQRQKRQLAKAIGICTLCRRCRVVRFTACLRCRTSQAAWKRQARARQVELAGAF